MASLLRCLLTAAGFAFARCETFAPSSLSLRPNRLPLEALARASALTLACWGVRETGGLNSTMARRCVAAQGAKQTCASFQTSR